MTVTGGFPAPGPQDREPVPPPSYLRQAPMPQIPMLTAHKPGIVPLRPLLFGDILDGAVKAVRFNPSHDLAYYERGLAYRDKRDYDRAINDFSQAIRIDGKNAAAFENRGLAYRMKNDLDRAIADFDQALRLDPKSPTAFNDRGTSYAPGAVASRVGEVR